MLVVDDGSDDNTAQFAREAGAYVVESPENRGYGNALKTAFDWAERLQVDRLVVLDGDGQHDPDDIPRLLDAQQTTGANMVIGNRFGGSSSVPLVRRFGLAIINLLANLVFLLLPDRQRIDDTQSGFRAYDRSAIESIASSAVIGDGMEASLDILFHCQKNRLQIAEVETEIRYDVADPNSHSPFRHGFRVVMNTLQLVEQEYPLRVLGLPGLVSLSLGIGFGYWTILLFINIGEFALGRAISATLFGVSGLVTLIAAIILHALSSTHS